MTQITVLMTAYNNERYIAQAVRSVLAQTYRDFELYLVDDGSADATKSIAESYARDDSRIRLVSQANKGMGESSNEALEAARGEWVVRLDADDEMFPDRLERHLAFLRGHPGVAASGSPVEYIDEEGRALGRSSTKLTDPAAVKEAFDALELLHIHHPASVVRRDALRAIGGYRPQYWPADDADLWNRFVEAGYGLLVQPECLTRYRIHKTSVCVSKAGHATRKLEWVQESMLCRRAGKPEPTWEQFTAAQDRKPWPARLNRARRNRARTLYKNAAFDYARRQYPRSLSKLLGATMLEPGYVLHKLAPRLLAARASA